MRPPALVAAVACSISLSAQTPEKRTFEVASIKTHPTSEYSYSLGPAGDRFVATNVTLRQLVQFAVRPVPARVFIDSQIVGGPAWINTDRFDVQAKAGSGGRTLPFEDLRQMTESLLEERFRLRTHREKRETTVYALVVLNSGVKIKRAATQVLPGSDGMRRVFDPNAPQQLGSLIMVPTRPGDSTITFSGSAAGMLMLTNVLQGFVDRLVVDETNLTGLFDFRLEFSR